MQYFAFDPNGAVQADQLGATGGDGSDDQQQVARRHGFRQRQRDRQRCHPAHTGPVHQQCGTVPDPAECDQDGVDADDPHEARAAGGSARHQAA